MHEKPPAQYVPGAFLTYNGLHGQQLDFSILGQGF